MQTAKKMSDIDTTDRRADAARRALAEAAARRDRLDERRFAATPEIGGREGPDPARYGDWEKNGIASDF
ncbi:MAG: DUF1674 domain-containing protein [Hyphomicrobiales bacterium]